MLLESRSTSTRKLCLSVLGTILEHGGGKGCHHDIRGPALAAVLRCARSDSDATVRSAAIDCVTAHIGQYTLSCVYGCGETFIEHRGPCGDLTLHINLGMHPYLSRPVRRQNNKYAKVTYLCGENVCEFTNFSSMLSLTVPDSMTVDSLQQLLNNSKKMLPLRASY